jgi:peroxiredoxin
LRPFFAAVLVLVLAAPVLAQDVEDPDSDDANPMKLSRAERDAVKKFNQLETFALEALRERDLDGAERRYKKLLKKLDEDETLNEPTLRKLKSYAHYNLACTYSRDKQTEDAVAELEKSLEYGFWGWKHMKKDEDLDNIRDDDGYRKAIKHGKALEAKAFEEEEEALVAQVTSSLAAKAVVKGFTFDVTPTSGDGLALQELRGKVVVVDVFLPYQDTGDPAEVPALEKLHEEYRKKGVVVLGVTPLGGGDATQYLEQFLRDQEVKYPLAGVRPGDDVLRCYNESYGETRLIFIDKRGKVRGTAKRLRSYETLEAVVKLLAQSPDPKKD